MKRLIILFFLCAAACLGDDTWARDNGNWFRNGGNWGKSEPASGWTDPYSPHIVLYMQETNGAPTFVDSSGSGLDGTPLPSVGTGPTAGVDLGNRLIDGTPELAFEFDGTDDAIDFGTAVRDSFANPTSVTEMTICYWINPDTVTGNDGTFAFGLFNNSHGTFDCHLIGSTLYTAMRRGPNARTDIAAFTNANIWSHITHVWDVPNGYLGTYVNGVVASTNPVNSTTDSMNIITNYKFIGGAYYGSAYGLDGTMDDFRVYTNALIPAEIMSIYTNTTHPTNSIETRLTP